MEGVLKTIISGISNTFGEAFFSKLTLTLSEVVSSDYTYIALVDNEKIKASTLVFVAGNQVTDNFEYSLIDTPCENVVADSICVHRENVGDKFPQDELLKEMNLQAYIGVPLHDSQGKVIGLIAALYKQTIDCEKQAIVTTLFQLFSGRVAGELTRMKHEKEIEIINQNLEHMIDERSRELEQSMRVIDLAQDKLVESEKLAALVDLVSGIAHDVNTPLGVAITAETHLNETVKGFKDKFVNNTLKRSDITFFIEQNEEAISIIHRNLDRAKGLVENFKKTAADQHRLERELINLNDYYQQVSTMLSPLLKRKNVELKVNCDSMLEIVTYPGAHAQIVTNLVNNSVMHGFKNEQKNEITINIVMLPNKLIQVDYRDNGIGIEPEICQKIYEPFYTTARDNGGTGLGMSIIFNILAKKLDGEITCHSERDGAHFTYTFKNLGVER